MKKRSLLLLSVLGLVGIASSRRETADLTAPDKAAIRKVLDDGVAYLRAANSTAYAGLYSEDAIILPPDEPSVRGRSAIQAWIQAFPAIESVTISDVQLSGEGNFAFSTLAFALKLKGAPPEIGKELLVLRRSSGGKWELVAASFSSDSRAPTQGVEPAK